MLQSHISSNNSWTETLISQYQILDKGEIIINEVCLRIKSGQPNYLPSIDFCQPNIEK